MALLGRRVVAIDADIGLRNLDVVMGLENRIVYDLVNVVEGACRLRQAMIRDKRIETLYLIPSAQSRDKSAITPHDFVAVCDQLRADFGFILIDSPAGIEQGFRNAIAPADQVIIVTTPDVSAVRDADRVVGLIEAEGKETPRLIVNRLRADMVNRGDMLDTADVIDVLAIDLLGIVPEDESIIVSTNRGVPAVLQNHSRAGQAFKNVAGRLLGQDIPFMRIEEAPTGFFRRLTQKVVGRG